MEKSINDKNCQINEATQFWGSVIDFKESDKDAIYLAAILKSGNQWRSENRWLLSFLHATQRRVSSVFTDCFL